MSPAITESNRARGRCCFLGVPAELRQEEHFIGEFKAEFANSPKSEEARLPRHRAAMGTCAPGVSLEPNRMSVTPE